MKDNVDIEDLFKDELGNQEVVPTSKSFAGSRVRRFMNKMGLKVIAGSMVVAVGVAGASYFYNAAETSSVKGISRDTSSIIDDKKGANTDQNGNTISVSIDDNNPEVRSAGVGLVDETHLGMSKTTPCNSVTSNESSSLHPNVKRNNNAIQNSTSVNQINTNSSGDKKLGDSPEKKSNKKESNQGSKTQDGPTASNISASNEQNNLTKESKVETNDALGGEEIIITKKTDEDKTNSNSINDNGDESNTGDGKTEDDPLTKESSTVKEVANISGESAAQSNTINTSNGVVLEQEFALTGTNADTDIEAEKEIKQPTDAIPDSAGSPAPVLVDVASEQPADSSTISSDSTKRKRRFKFSVGALYVHQMDLGSPYDYSSFFSYSFQSGIKYPFHNNKFQINTGIDFTVEKHHFYKTSEYYGDFEEVNEIHVLLKKIDIPLAVDYKLPVKIMVDLRLGVGLKYSKIITDDEEAWNELDEIVEDVEEDNPFIVDELSPSLLNPFLYLNVSKKISSIRANFMLYYYFRKYQMDGYSKTFVSDHFNPSSLRLGVSVDF